MILNSVHSFRDGNTVVYYQVYLDGHRILVHKIELSKVYKSPYSMPNLDSLYNMLTTQFIQMQENQRRATDAFFHHCPPPPPSQEWIVFWCNTQTHALFLIVPNYVICYQGFICNLIWKQVSLCIWYMLCVSAFKYGVRYVFLLIFCIWFGVPLWLFVVCLLLEIGMQFLVANIIGSYHKLYNISLCFKFDLS